MLRGPRRSPTTGTAGDSTPPGARQADAKIQVALTFDDGPDPVLTPRLLDALAELDWKATFFVLGRQAEQSPHLIRRIVAEGHDLGNHTYSHPDARDVPSRVFLADAIRARCILEDVSGKPVRLFRPPFGRLTLRVAAGLWSHGATIVLWSCDPRDYGMRDEDQMLRWCDCTRLRSGEIVLLHDVHPWAERAVREWCRMERERSTMFVPVSAWLGSSTKTGSPTRQPTTQPMRGESRHAAIPV